MHPTKQQIHAVSSPYLMLSRSILRPPPVVHHTPHACLVWVNVSAWHHVSRESPFRSHWQSSLMPRPCPLTNKRGLVANWVIFGLCWVSNIDFEQTLVTSLHVIVLFHWFTCTFGWRDTISLACPNQNCWVQPRNHSIVSHQTLKGGIWAWDYWWSRC